MILPVPAKDGFVSGFARPVDRQEMANNRPVGTRVVGKYLGLEVGIGLRNPFVLAQVLRQDSTMNHSTIFCGSAES